MNGAPTPLPAVIVVVATAWVVVRVGAATASWKVFEEVWGVGVLLSVAVTVKTFVANRAVAVPEIWPVEVEKLSPAGRDPPLRA